MSYQPPNQPPNQGPQGSSPYQPYQQPTGGGFPNAGNQQGGFGQGGFQQAGGYQTGGYVQPPPKKNRTCLILFLVFGGLGGVCSLCVCGFVALAMYTEDMPVTARDREVLVEATDVAQFVDDFQPKPSNETTTKGKQFDGSIELNYMYEDTVDEEEPYIDYTVYVLADESTADTEMETMWSASLLVFKLLGGGGVDVSERNDIFRWGEDSRFAIVQNEGQPVGNLFVARKGNILIVFMIVGIYFEDDAFSDLMMPAFSKLEGYNGE